MGPKEKRERRKGRVRARERESDLGSSVLIAVRHRHSETQPCTNGGLAGGKQVFERSRGEEFGKAVSSLCPTQDAQHFTLHFCFSSGVCRR